MPFSPSTGRRAKADDSTTWGTHAEAVAADSRRDPVQLGGIGIELGDLGDGTFLGGIDLDTCRDPSSGALTTWAEAVLQLADTYAEVSPSGTGAKLYFLASIADLDAIRALLPPRADGTPVWGFTWAEPGQRDHPPAIELHLGNRYFAWTEQRVGTTPDTLRTLDLDFFEWLALEAGPELSGKPTIPEPKGAARQEKRERRQLAESATRGDTGQPVAARIAALISEDRLNTAKRRLKQRWEGDWTGVRDTSGSGLAFALAASLKRCGFGQADVLAAVAEHPDTAAWAASVDSRQLERLYDRSMSASPGDDDKPRLLLEPHNPDRTVAAMRDILAKTGRMFDRGVPVRLAYDQIQRGMVAQTMTADSVVLETHRSCRPFVMRETAEGALEETNARLPRATATMYLDWRGEWRLPVLNGIASAPLLREDGRIYAADGYDAASGMWCENVPDLSALVPAQPTQQQAQAALQLLRHTFRTFPFGDAALVQEADASTPVVDLTVPPGADESGFLVGLLTAACRPSLHLAPGLLLGAAPMSGAGAGKGLLARAICTIAFGRSPHAVTGGATAEELEKRIAAELMEGAPALFLDNLNNRAFSSDLLASAITERPARVRLLGKSQMLPLNATAFIVLTGNGLTAVEDLARRFVTVQLDPRTENPEARAFTGDLLAEVAARRAELLAALLTIWRWGRQAGDAIKPGLALGSFGQWARWVRDPLLALGCMDPAERIGEAKAQDQGRLQMAELFSTWWQKHHDLPMQGKDLHEDVRAILDPQNRGRQFQAAELGRMVGARIAGLVMTRVKTQAKWSVATYALRQSDTARPVPSAPAPAADGGIGGGIGVGIGGATEAFDRQQSTDFIECRSAPPPMTPMPPMPLPTAAATPESWETAL
ncbi:hypothetical protein [Roseomonas sp. BN140053]|uniref:hypothetical protein n=1 Tax=Roseomonas sp. BN140053 TaxID=3391898 RepID=UPI0039EAA835